MAMPRAGPNIHSLLYQGRVVTAIRIVVGRLPQLLHDIVRDVLGGQVDMNVVNKTVTEEELWRVVAIETPDVVVVELNADGLDPLGNHVLRHQPNASVLGLSADGRFAAMYQLRLHRTTVLEVSPEGLRKAIRSAMEVTAS
jgi:DNA-binding NarL/FixJ family response regulator